MPTGTAMEAAEIARVSSPRAGQFRTIQALRFFAALAVVVAHTGFYAAERLDPSRGFWTLGTNGVRVFFVISGFVMIISSDDLLTRARGWSVFAVKRILRIVPMYWIGTGFKLAMLLLVPAAVLHAQLDWLAVVKSLLFWPTYNVDGEIRPLLGVGWTLTYEMFFYALFTIALLVRVNPVRALTPILLALALLSLARTPSWPVELSCWADPIVLDFLAGMLLARWHQAGGQLPATAACTVFGLGVAYLFLPVPHYRGNAMIFSLGMTIASTMVLTGAVSLEHHVGRAIPRLLMLLGASSYALYLMHPLVAPAVPSVFAKLHAPWPVLAIVVSIAAAIVAGLLCHLLIERPATRALTRHAKQFGLIELGAPFRHHPDRTIALERTEV